MTSELRLRLLRPEDEAAALAANEKLAKEGFQFLLGHTTGESWLAYLQRLEDQSRRINVPADWVPGMFLLAVEDGVMVGRVSVRYELNDYLASFGGHIGYAVLPEHRRRGHATEMLRQALLVARSQGVDSVLLTCDNDNIASMRVIERCGGVFDGIVEKPGASVPVRRYWIL